MTGAEIYGLIGTKRIGSSMSSGTGVTASSPVMCRPKKSITSLRPSSPTAFPSKGVPIREAQGQLASAQVQLATRTRPIAT
jgi:hypothetical protein